ncbi:MAG: hypothetical protein C4308_06925 [Chitinophagaceae bacterium]
MLGLDGIIDAVELNVDKFQIGCKNKPATVQKKNARNFFFTCYCSAFQPFFAKHFHLLPRLSF